MYLIKYFKYQGQIQINTNLYSHFQQFQIQIMYLNPNTIRYLTPTLMTIFCSIFGPLMITDWWNEGTYHQGIITYSIRQVAQDLLYTKSHRHGWIYQGLWLPSHRHGWTYQGLWLPSHTDTARHTKAFDYPVTQTRLDIPRSLITQSHRHGWTHQGLWLPSHTDMAGHTKAFDYPATQTRLDIPRSLITQSQRHGWTYQGLWLPSRGEGS